MIYRRIDGDRVVRPEADVSVDGDTTISRQRLATGPRPPGPAPDDRAMARLRRQTPAGEPLPLTFKWMAKLPPGVQPFALFRQFPRIANMMAGMWPDPQSLRPYLHDLLTDRRGHRKGFPQEIVQELLALRIHYEELYPAMLDAYKDVDKRG